MVTCRSHVLTQVWLNTCIPGPRAGAKKLIGVANECKSMQMNTTSKDRTCQSLDLCVVCSGSAAHVRLLLAVGRPCHLARVVTQSVQPLHASACAQGSMSKTCPTAFMLRYIDGVRMPKSKPATATGEYLKHCVRACTTNRCKSIKVQLSGWQDAPPKSLQTDMKAFPTHQHWDSRHEGCDHVVQGPVGTNGFCASPAPKQLSRNELNKPHSGRWRQFFHWVSQCVFKSFHWVS